MSNNQSANYLIKLLEKSLKQITNYQHKLDLKNVFTKACKPDGAFSFFNSQYYGSNCQQRNLITFQWIKHPQFIEYIYVPACKITRRLFPIRETLVGSLAIVRFVVACDFPLEKKKNFKRKKETAPLSPYSQGHPQTNVRKNRR